MTHFSFSLPFCCTQLFSSCLNALRVVTNYVAESAAEQQQTMNPEHVNTWAQTNRNTTGPGRRGYAIGLDSECQPMGQISCVMMRNRPAV